MTSDIPPLRVIGHVESLLTDRDQAPRQPDEGDAPPAILHLDLDLGAGLVGLRPGQVIVVVTWLHAANRDVLAVHPRDDTSRPLTGVFATRSAGRPNPIGLHRVTITSIDGYIVGVDHLEAIDGTPILDIKPVLGPEHDR
jgi:tRNA-Thr(GGU) m(6)t(6)A37 methyltransferase TsaA